MNKGSVLITGASEGMGREFARLFAQNGYPLILVARNQNRLSEIASALTSQYHVDIRILPKDLSAPNAAEELKAELDRQNLIPEILVNNAGFGVYGFFHKSDWKATESMLLLNMVTLTHLTRLLLPAMIQRRSGKILNVASTAAFQPGPLMAVYFASKAYVLYFTEAIANEVAGTGVTVTTFCPGPTKTQFQKRSNTEHIRETTFSMDAAKAVKAAYHGLMKGKTLVVPGFWNNVLAILVRLSPRKIVMAVTRFLEEAR